jgi:hypothetical protein
MEFIVIVTTGSALLFSLAWWKGPAFRVWIERPKYHFLNRVERFDEANAMRRPR